jgi:hypothetical protein
MFLGYHLSPEDLQFEKGSVRTWVAGDWVGERVTSRRSADGDLSAAEEAVADWLSYRRPADRAARFSRGQIVLRYAWATDGSGSVDQVALRHWPVFCLLYSRRTELEAIQQDIGRIADLITLCSGESDGVRDLSISRPDLRTRMLSGDLGPEADIKLLAPQMGYSRLGKRKTRHAHKMLLTFDELGGIEAVARWLDLCPKFSRALGSMMSVKRASQIFTENRFLNVAFAAEAYHRDVYGGVAMAASDFEALLASCLGAVSPERQTWLQQRLRFANAPSFRRRLLDLTGEAAEFIGPMLGKVRPWADVITGVRNHLTHLDSAKSSFSGSDLFYLSESVYAVVRICMLLKVGAEKEAIALRSGSYGMVWYGPRLAEALERVARELSSTSTAPHPGLTEGEEA